MGNKPKATTSSDPKLIYHAASDFRIGSEILESRFGQRIFPLRSTVVTAALAAELFLKCLITLKAGAYPNEHELDKLFDALDKTQQTWVEAAFAAKNTGASLQGVLKAASRVFVEWRYIFEEQPDGVSLDFFRSLRTLVEALNSVVLASKPEWSRVDT